MTGKQSGPPASALWLLRHTCPGERNEPLTGDLIERFREGQTRGWFWRQVFIASAVNLLGALRRRWSFFCYAIAATVAMGVNNPLPGQISSWLHWGELPWPWSQLVFELINPALLALTSLSILAIGLMIARSFRWTYLVRTWIISLALIAMGHFSMDLFPWLLRSIPGDPYHKALIVPGVVQLLSLFATFLVAAWLGCPMQEHACKSERPAGEDGF